MANDVQLTIGDGACIHMVMAMREKRFKEGKSIRALGEWIGIPFSSLARM